MTRNKYQYDINNQAQQGILRVPNTKSMTVPEAAAEWARAGWQPIPTNLRTCAAPFPWSTVEGLSPMEIQELFERWPNSRLSIILPVSVVVLDIDHRPDEKGWYADVILQRMQDRYQLPLCPVCLTPRGGMHLWLALPPGLRARNWTAQLGRFPVDGVDIRTYRGLATVPPTSRLDGAYAWQTAERTLPLAPALLCNDLQPPSRSRKPRKSLLYMSQSQRSAYVATAYSSEVRAVATSGRGGRNDQLFRSAAALGAFVAGGALQEEEVRGSLILAAQECGLSRDDGVPSVLATIASGFRTGFQSPRKAPRSMK